MKVIYRLSDAGYKKEKPEYINNKLCLRAKSSARPEDIARQLGSR